MQSSLRLKIVLVAELKVHTRNRPTGNDDKFSVVALAVTCLYARHLFSTALIGNEQTLELTMRTSEDKMDTGFLAEKTCVDTGLAHVSISFVSCHASQATLSARVTPPWMSKKPFVLLLLIPSMA